MGSDGKDGGMRGKQWGEGGCEKSSGAAGINSL